MSFVGEANRLGDAWVRPHELEIVEAPSADSVEAMIERITLYGFDARVELTPAEGDVLTVQLTRRAASRSSSSSRARSCGCEPPASGSSREPAARSARRTPRRWLLFVLSLSMSVAQLGAVVPGGESCGREGSVAVVVCLRAWGP